MEMLNMCEKSKGGIPLSVTDIKAARKWSKICKYPQERLLSNVYCSACGLATIIELSMHDVTLVSRSRANSRNAARTL